jgi:CRP-like cAMP-binding protein
VLDDLMAHLQPKLLEKDQVLFQAGDRGSDMFVVQSGKLNCINTDKQVVKVLAAGAAWHLARKACRPVRH